MVAVIVATLGLLAVSAGQAATDRAVTAGPVGVRVDDGWSRVLPVAANDDGDARTVLVVGTAGVAPRVSECQVSAYRVPDDGAAVVVLGRRGTASNALPHDRSQLQALRLKRPLFKCFDGRGAAAQIVIKGRAYQINVLVGDRADRSTVAAALAAARSFAAA